MSTRSFSKPDPFDLALWGLIVTLVIAAIYYFQLRSMQATVEQMQTQTRLSIRPFVGLDEGSDALQATPLQIDGDGNASLEYRIRAKNYSNFPASNVWADANLVVADDLYSVYEQQDYACGDALIGKPDIGFILFQGRDRFFVAMPAMTKISSKHQDQGSRLQAFLAGCIGYRDQFGYLYRTRFIWMLHDDAGKVVMFDRPTQPTTIGGHFVPTGTRSSIDAGQVPKYK